MKPWLRNSCRALLPLLLSVPLHAQSISLKTVPIATGEQFVVFPSRTIGMAGLSLAHEDSLFGSFANPARGALLTGTWVAAAPAFYGATVDNVGGRTLPLTVVHGGANWFGAVSVAIQQIDSPERQQWWWLAEVQDALDNVLIDDEASNSYLYGSLGRKLGSGRTAIGASAYYAELNAMDGVGQLYARSASIQQSGTIRDLRLGVTHQLAGERRLEGMIGNSSVDMTHDVVYVTGGMWGGPGPTWQDPVVSTEHNLDRTTTWSASLRYTAPLAPGTRLGAILVGNTKSHPKIPNYELVNIPRDPGNSALFAAGAGLSAREGPDLLGLELLLQPGRSHTWAFADTAIVNAAGSTIERGEKTVDNRFTFANWSLAAGWQHDWKSSALQLGLRLNRYGYELEQKNFLRASERTTRESWIEWSPSWGFMLKLGRGEARYSGRFVSKGFDFPSFLGGAETDAIIEFPAQPGGGDFLVAPTDPVMLPDFRVTLHQLMFAVPIGGKR